MTPHRLLLPALLLCASSAAAELIPTDRRFEPLRLELHRVETAIDDQTAITRVTQVFANHHRERLEAIYVFPTPAEASIVDFAMTIDGRLMRGELLERKQAREVYEKIVRRAKDPGLLEQIGKNVFRMRVFPIEPGSKQRVELTYVERIPYQRGRCTWRHPLRTPGTTAATRAGALEVSVRVNSSLPIGEIEGASHDFAVERGSERAAVVTWNQGDGPLERDLEFSYRVTRPESGFDLIAHRCEEAGHFALLITPGANAADVVLPKDMTFVFDTSGSMCGQKMEQAKAALKFCIDHLGAEDRFNIVTFSDEVASFDFNPVPADEAHRAAALHYIDRTRALGGTNIADALARALRHRPEAGRPHVVLFLTDGLPSMGDTDAGSILRRTLGAGNDEVRVFTFGVGADVNRDLLDQLAEGTRAIATFVAPGEDLERPVSELQRRIAAPVITNLEIDWGGADVHEVYPRRIPDLYADVQLSIAGRYSRAGTYPVTVRGRQGTRPFEIRQEVAFPERREEAGAIPYLWAARRVGDLLDAIRRHGENRELVADVIRLAREYRIVTPYTSFLVLESEAAYDVEGLPRRGADFTPPGEPARDRVAVERASDPVPTELVRDQSETLDDEEFQSLGEEPASEDRANSQGFYDTIGVGGGGGSNHGGRSSRRRLVARGGGREGTESAVRAGLAWLARHQNADGSWSAVECGEPPCASGSARSGEVRRTALSLLAFLGAGITHLSKETAQDPVTQAPLDLGRTVRNGLRWLVRAQHSDGAMADPGDRDAAETHDLATLVLAEFFGLTASPLVKDPADRALQFLEAHRPGPEQPRAFLWAVYAFETAARSGLRDRSALQDLLSRGGTPAGDSPSSRAVRILCATLSGGQTAEEDSTALLGASLPGDAEEVFHVTTALFLSDGPDSGHSGKFWKSWNRKITETLLASRPGASARCAAGSWDGGDRVIVTALRVLTLEVYYRYDFVVWRRK